MLTNTGKKNPLITCCHSNSSSSTVILDVFCEMKHLQWNSTVCLWAKVLGTLMDRSGQPRITTSSTHVNSKPLKSWGPRPASGTGPAHHLTGRLTELHSFLLTEHTDDVWWFRASVRLILSPLAVEPDVRVIQKVFSHYRWIQPWSILSWARTSGECHTCLFGKHQSWKIRTDGGRSESTFAFKAPGEKTFSLQTKASVNTSKLPEHVVGFWPSLPSSSAAPSHEWPSLAVAPSVVKRLDPIWQERSSKRPVWQLGSSRWFQMAPESPFRLDPAHRPHLPEPPCGWGGSASWRRSLYSFYTGQMCKST